MSVNGFFGITYPSIDELLEKVTNEENTNSDVAKKMDGAIKGSKFALASFGAARGRQIVNYFSNLQAGMYSDFEVGPLVDYYQNEKPLSIAMREIHLEKLNLIPGNKVEVVETSNQVVDALDSIMSSISEDENADQPETSNEPTAEAEEVQAPAEA